MPSGGKFGQDLVRWIDGRPKHQHSLITQQELIKDSYNDVPKLARPPKQPNDFRGYQPTHQTPVTPHKVAEELTNLEEVTPTEIFNIYSQRAERINQAAITARKKIHEHERKMLPEEMLAKIDQNKYDIETQKYAVEGHKTTIANALHVFNGKEWEDLRQVGEKFMQAIQEHDSYTANACGYNFIMGVFATQPAYLSIIDIYEEVLEKAIENYEMALEILDANTEKLVKAEKEIEPKRIVKQQAARIKRLELALLKANAGYELEEEEDEEEEEVVEDELQQPQEDGAVGKPIKPEGVDYGRQSKKVK